MNPANLLRITPLGPESIHDTLGLFDAQLREHGIVTPVDAIEKVVQSVVTAPSQGFILLAVMEGAPVGVAFAAAHLNVEHGGVIGWLEELYVIPSRRGAGVGSRLLDETIARSRLLHWKGLELEVVAGHERVVPLYTRHQFEPVARSRFRLPL